MQSVRRSGVEHEWQTVTLVAAGLGLGAVGGFVGSWVHDRNEGLTTWGVGSFRSRWTTFRTSPSAAGRVSSGSSTR